MTVDEMLAGDWKLLIAEAPADLAMTVAFDGGVVRENGLDVGTYEVAGSRLTASIGEDVTLCFTLTDMSPVLPGIEEVAPNVLQGTSTTRIPEMAGAPDMEGDNLIEAAVLTRVSHDRTAPSEVFARLRAVDGGKSLAMLLQGEWEVTVDDQPPEDADKLIVEDAAASWNGRPVPITFDGERATVDLGASRYEIKRYYRDATRTDRFDANQVFGPGEIINGQMDRVRVGNTGPRTDI